MPQLEHSPYKSINVYIERDFLEGLLESILQGFNELPKEDQLMFVKAFKQHVTILGFRNPLRAPLRLQINAYATAFEENDEVVPFTLTTWAKMKSELAENVNNWLDSEGWKDLALEREYEESQGFSGEWPEALTFDAIAKKFEEAHPKFDFSQDELILMVIWVSGKLPPEQSVI